MGDPILYAKVISIFLKSFGVPIMFIMVSMSMSRFDLANIFKIYVCFVCFGKLRKRLIFSKKCVFPATRNVDCERLVLCLNIFGPATCNTDCGCRNILIIVVCHLATHIL